MLTESVACEHKNFTFIFKTLRMTAFKLMDSDLSLTSRRACLCKLLPRFPWRRGKILRLANRKSSSNAIIKLNFIRLLTCAKASTEKHSNTSGFSALKRIQNVCSMKESGSNYNFTRTRSQVGVCRQLFLLNLLFSLLIDDSKAKAKCREEFASCYLVSETKVQFH